MPHFVFNLPMLVVSGMAQLCVPYKFTAWETSLTPRAAE